MKIAVIGAGWMGLHISYILSKKGYDIKIYELANKIFSGMSGHNTNRLHMGYHYPRSLITRMQSIDGFKKFVKEYPNLYKKIPNNYIAIAKKGSHVNFNNYKKIMISSGLKIKETQEMNNQLINIEGIIKSPEGLILHEKAAEFFLKKIKKILKLNKTPKKIVLKNSSIYLDNIRYDWVIDCTALQWRKNNLFNISFEPRITHVYKSNLKNFALMIMDGNFFNIFPLKNNLYTLGTPKYSKFKKFKNINKAKLFYKKIINKEVIKRKKLSEDIIANFYPNYKKIFKYVGYYKSITTIFNSKKDSRPTLVKKEKKLITVLGGKIDTIFEAERKILEILK